MARQQKNFRRVQREEKPRPTINQIMAWDMSLLIQSPGKKRLVRALYPGEFPDDLGYNAVVLTRGPGGYVRTATIQTVAEVQGMLDDGLELYMPKADATLRMMQQLSKDKR